MKKLRIAQVSPLIESVPPKKYGGTERVVYYLTEGLVERGHEVTLFASGDSVTSARLVAPVKESLRRRNMAERSGLSTTSPKGWLSVATR
ncbi:glycosyltransferase [Chlorobaculum sp. MV4-Y]|uniref:glycosyltransferase n=1 Tax=Chlorobaculum sp. MV4-Y TaxID=2976335 RepID=UPI0021AED1DD|nr:glycosyltransferase [Chlorobaculum sp. MV4-Y]UWX56751.1 glycosyltransferase [Chlorobaculum sp. MV4-Y]